MNKQISDFIRALNRTWQTGDWTRVGEFFDPDVVLLPPDALEPILGRDAVVDTYRDFAENAVLNTFTILDLRVFEFPEVHMAHMAFEVDFTHDNTRNLDGGIDVYAVVATPAPRIVWRSQQIHTQRIVSG